jgi:geranylgeranyl diphosphate synthase type I
LKWEQEIRRQLAENAEKVDEFIYGEIRGDRPAALYEASRHLIKAGGKRLRPFLTVKACEAVGGDPAEAVPYAAALEVLHNFTLVHDDVMDQYGVPMAILAGDLLFAKVYDIVANHAPRNMRPAEIVRCFNKITEATLTLCQGQALDMEFPDAKDVSEEEYISMVSAKTSALFRACAEVGAIAGGAPDDQVDSLGKFAWDAGIAFQIVDDVLGLTADEDKLGKPVGSDVREGKKTLIVIHALAHAKKKQRDALLRALGVEEADDDAISKAVEALRASGSIQYAKDTAKRYMDSAYIMLERLPDSAAKTDLRALVNYFVNREY